MRAHDEVLEDEEDCSDGVSFYDDSSIMDCTDDDATTFKNGEPAPIKIDVTMGCFSECEFDVSTMTGYLTYDWISD